MVHQLEQLSQNNLAWSTSPLGTSSITLGAAGCYVTSFSVLAAYYGHKITPFEMNRLLVERKLFVSQNLISNPDDLEDIFPDIKFTMSYYFNNSTGRPADLAILRDILSDPNKTVIVCINIHDKSLHFTPVIDCDGERVTIMNVWNGQVEDFTKLYGDPKKNIIRFIVYTGTPAEREPSQQEIIDRLRLERDHNYNLTVAILDRLNLHPTDNDPVDEQVEKAGALIDQMKSELEILRARINLLSPSEEESSSDLLVLDKKKKGKNQKGKSVSKSDSIVSVEKVTILDSIVALLRKGGIIE